MGHGKVGFRRLGGPIETREKKLIEVDATELFQSIGSALLTQGGAAVVTSNYDAAGVLQAESVGRVMVSSASWLPDRALDELPLISV